MTITGLIHGYTLRDERGLVVAVRETCRDCVAFLAAMLGGQK